jgi:hypothetical protein
MREEKDDDERAICVGYVSDENPNRTSCSSTIDQRQAGTAEIATALVDVDARTSS